jgi:hypothetical protein
MTILFPLPLAGGGDQRHVTLIEGLGQRLLPKAWL